MLGVQADVVADIGHHGSPRAWPRGLRELQLPVVRLGHSAAGPVDNGYTASVLHLLVSGARKRIAHAGSMRSSCADQLSIVLLRSSGSPRDRKDGVAVARRSDSIRFVLGNRARVAVFLAYRCSNWGTAKDSPSYQQLIGAAAALLDGSGIGAVASDRRDSTSTVLSG